MDNVDGMNVSPNDQHKWDPISRIGNKLVGTDGSADQEAWNQSGATQSKSCNENLCLKNTCNGANSVPKEAIVCLFEWFIFEFTTPHVPHSGRIPDM